MCPELNPTPLAITSVAPYPQSLQSQYPQETAQQPLPGCAIPPTFLNLSEHQFFLITQNMEVTTPCWFCFFFLKVDTGTHLAFSTLWIALLQVTQHPAPLGGLTVTVPRALSSSWLLTPASPEAQNILATGGMLRLLWLFPGPAASPCCFLEDYTGKKENERVGYPKDQMEAPKREQTPGDGARLCWLESSLYSLPATSEPAFLHL